MLTSRPGEPESIPDDLCSGDEKAMLVLEQIKRQEEASSGRLDAVERKLQGVVPVCSVVVAVVLALLVNVAAKGILRLGPKLTTAGIIVAAYISLQILRAVLATIVGLERKGFERLTIEKIVPLEGETEAEYQCRIARERASCLTQNQEVVNERVSQMAVAHEALLNAVVVLVASVIAVAALMIYLAWDP